MANQIKNMERMPSTITVVVGDRAHASHLTTMRTE